MAQKVIWETELNELSTSDVEGVGVIRRDKKGQGFKWIKNTGTTALVADGCCVYRIVSTAVQIHTKVIGPDGVGASTAVVTDPAGVPVTGIGASGSSTGCYGWVKAEGYHKVSMMQSATAADQASNCVAIATSVQPATYPWGKPATSVHSTAVGQAFASRVVLMESFATTGVATAASCLVKIQCLP
jgi:hypothetical protein